jgi:hypothetical protein
MSYSFMTESIFQPQNVALLSLAIQSQNGGVLDIKASLGMDRYTGMRWDDNTVTSLRIAGNILFGINMETARSVLSDKDEFYMAAMNLVGSYNQSQNGGTPSNPGYNSGYPFYGEHTLSGNAIFYGYYGYKYHQSN